MYLHLHPHLHLPNYATKVLDRRIVSLWKCRASLPDTNTKAGCSWLLYMCPKHFNFSTHSKRMKDANVERWCAGG